jgi:hypothetical protein
MISGSTLRRRSNSLSANGDMVAVAIFHDDVEAPSQGWVEFFAIDKSGEVPRLVPTGQRLSMPRGAHDLAVDH